MNDPARNFLRQLLHQAINSGIHSLLWRLPTLMLVLVISAMIFAVWYWQLF